MPSVACPAPVLHPSKVDSARQCVARAASPSQAASHVTSETQESELAEYIASGPLLKSCGISAESVRQNAGEWDRLGRQLARQLEFDHDNMNDAQKLRIYRYYLPIYFWLLHQLELHRREGKETAMVLGISAPQGCGKSTLVEQLQELLDAEGLAAAAVSVDDFYLTRGSQAELAAAHPANRLLQLRGNAGTHDLALGTSTLTALAHLTQHGTTARVPRYDKSAYGGLGDRAPEGSWPQVSGPLAVVLFEGWMAGFEPLPEQQAAAVDPDLSTVNRLLGAYRAAWDEHVDAWLVIRIEDPQCVYGWRLQAEERMKAGGRPGMSAEAVADFVSRFMPAYAAHLPRLYAAGPTTARAGRCLAVAVDGERCPLAQQPPQPQVAQG